MFKKQTSAKKGETPGIENIRKKIRDMKAELLILNIAIVILGVLMIAMPNQFQNFMAQIAGVGLIIWGVLKCIAFVRLKSEEMFGSYALVQGAAMLGFGVFFLTQPDKFNDLLNLAISLIILVIAVLKIQNAINYLKLKIEKWWIHLISALVIMAFGIITITKPGNMDSDIALILTGCAFVISGIWDIISVFIMSRFIKKTAKALEKNSKYVYAEAEDNNTSDKNKKDENFENDGFDDFN